MDNIRKIGLVIETDRIFGKELLRGIAQYSRIHGPWLIHNETKYSKNLLNRLIAWKCDGLIMRDQSENFALLDIGVPTVIVPTDHKPDECHANIISNDNAIGKLAAEYFIQRGFKQFGYCGFDDVYWSVLRWKSFSKYLNTKGFKVFSFELHRSIVEKEWEKDQRSLSQWIMSLPKPVAIFSCNDKRGLHVIEACKLVSLPVPERVAVLGVDNDEVLCDLSGYQLSSIPLNSKKAGQEGAKILDMLMRGKNTIKTIIVEPTSVITRETTDILAIENKNVADALSYIRKNANRPLQVSEVIDTLYISRRALYQQFRDVLGSTIYDEIMRYRIEEFARLLLETDMTITQISYALGESSNKHIARPFQKYKGMSPKEYRKQYKKTLY